MNRSERNPVGVTLDQARTGAARERPSVDDEPHRRLLLVEHSPGIDARPRPQQLREALGGIALALRPSAGEERIAHQRVTEATANGRIGSPRVRELVEHRLHEHAVLGLEFELSVNHAVGLHPDPPELGELLPLGPS